MEPRIHRYDLREFPFPKLVSEILKENDLSSLKSGLPIRRRDNDQDTQWHKLFYDNFHTIEERFRWFVAGEISKLVNDKFYYQKIPTFRVHLPHNLAVGEFHKDSDYGHPVEEITFWCPMTKCWDTNALQIVSPEDGVVNIAMAPGEMLIFDAANTEHGNYINETGKSRVSFDFRVLPVKHYKENSARSINRKLRFSPGEYYAEEIVG